MTAFLTWWTALGAPTQYALATLVAGPILWAFQKWVPGVPGGNTDASVLTKKITAGLLALVAAAAECAIAQSWNLFLIKALVAFAASQATFAVANRGSVAECAEDAKEGVQ